MSWMKDQAAKARNIQVTAEDLARAAKTPASEPKTAPGQLMKLQATVGQQRDEIAALKAMLEQSGSLKRPISRMHEVPGRRRKLSPEAYAELKANLEQYPLAQPVVLETRPDGDWDIVAGNNRVAIYGDLGRDEIDSVVISVPPDMVERVAFFSNLLAPSLPDFEKYWNLRQLEADTGMERQELAAAVGLSKGHISRIMAFDRLPEAAHTLLAECPHVLGSSAAQKLAAAATDGRAELVIHAVQKLTTDDSFTQDDAVRMVQVKTVTSKANDAEPLVIRNGKKKVVEITARNGVVGVRFTQDPERSAEWAKKLHAFIEAELKSQQAEDKL